MENYPGLEPVDGPGFVARLRSMLVRFGIAVEAGEVTGISVGDGGFLLDFNNGSVRAGAVIVATGTRAVRLDLPGAGELEDPKLFYEVAALFEEFPEPARIIVIGGGEAALDYSLSLAGRGAEVTLLIRGDRFRANNRLIEAVSAEARIEACFGVEAVGFEEGAEGVVVQARSSDADRMFPGQAVIAAIGREPALPVLPGGAGVGKGEPVATAIPGLFIAGDVRRGSLGQAGIAVGDGLEAAIQAVAWLRRRGEG
jgi:thioredoxin reductase (NADPH)